jgi:hypothetical protein
LGVFLKNQIKLLPMSAEGNSPDGFLTIMQLGQVKQRMLSLCYGNNNVESHRAWGNYSAFLSVLTRLHLIKR